MEIILGALICVVWFAVVIWGVSNLVVDARRKNDWENVGIAALSVATVVGPLLFVMPDYDLFGGHTKGLGAILAIISGLTIFASIMGRFKIR